MKELLDIIFPTLSDELIIVISLIIGLLVTASLILFLVKRYLRKQISANSPHARAHGGSWRVCLSVLYLSAITFLISSLPFSLSSLSENCIRCWDSERQIAEHYSGGILAIPIQYYLAYLAWYGAFIIFIPVVMFLVLPLRLVLKGDTHGITKSMALLQWILMLSVFGISHLAYLLSLPELPGFNAGGRGLLLFLVFLTEINDVMQFIWGKLLGRHKILPKVSPNKTWGRISGRCNQYYRHWLLPRFPDSPLRSQRYPGKVLSLRLPDSRGDVVISAIKEIKELRTWGTVFPVMEEYSTG